MSPTHGGAIESELTGGYQATCSCGWTGADVDSMKAAEAELVQHYDEVSL